MPVRGCKTNKSPNLEGESKGGRAGGKRAAVARQVCEISAHLEGLSRVPLGVLKIMSQSAKNMCQRYFYIVCQIFGQTCREGGGRGGRPKPQLIVGIFKALYTLLHFV